MKLNANYSRSSTDQVPISAEPAELTQLYKIIEASLSSVADPVIRDVDEARAKTLAGKIKQLAISDREQIDFTLSRQEFMDLASIISYMAVIGTDDYFPDLGIKEETVDQIHDDIWAIWNAAITSKNGM